MEHKILTKDYLHLPFAMEDRIFQHVKTYIIYYDFCAQRETPLCVTALCTVASGLST